jgi:hypothetical protein
MARVGMQKHSTHPRCLGYGTDVACTTVVVHAYLARVVDNPGLCKRFKGVYLPSTSM